MDVHTGGYDEEIGPLVSVFLLLFVFFTSTNHLSHFYRVLLKLLSYAGGTDKYLFIFIFILIFIDIFIGYNIQFKCN